MGTSSSYSPPTGGAWTRLKRRATRFAHGAEPVASLVQSYVAALGGSEAASVGAPAARETAQRLAAFVSDVGQSGLAEALRRRGIDSLSGLAVPDILARVIDVLAEHSDVFEESIARDAITAVLQTLRDECETPKDLEELLKRLDDLVALSDLLARFFAEYIFKRLLQVIQRQLRDGTRDKDDAANVERELREHIRLRTQVRLRGVDRRTFDWLGPDGAALMQRVSQDAFEVLGSDANG